MPRHFVSMYTDGPATRWNVIDRQTQEWIRRFASQEEAQQHANELNSTDQRQVLGPCDYCKFRGLVSHPDSHEQDDCGWCDETNATAA